MLTVNGRPYPFTKEMCLGELAKRVKPGADILILNGRIARPDTLLADGDDCVLIKKGEIPSALDMRRTLEDRHGKERQEIFARASVGIMGLGGLGSAVAIALARTGIGHLVLADHDVVELSNIHRQHYFIDQIGQKKTRALKKNLVRVNPFTSVTLLELKLDEKSIPRHFRDVDVLVECFDKAAMKAAALRAVLQRMPDTAYVGASGVAGIGSGDTIVCKRIRQRVYLVGDGQSDVAQQETLFAARVGIAAHHQANQVVRLLLGINEC